MAYENLLDGILKKFYEEEYVFNLEKLEDGAISFFLKEGKFIFSNVYVKLIFINDSGAPCEYKIYFLTRKRTDLLFKSSLYMDPNANIDSYKNEIISIIKKKKFIFGLHFYLKNILKILFLIFTNLISSAVNRESIEDKKSKKGAKSSSPKKSVSSNESGEKKNTFIYRSDKKSCATCLYWQGQRSLNSHGSIVEFYPNDAVCQVSKMTTDPITKRLKSASTRKTAPSFGGNCKYHRGIS